MLVEVLVMFMILCFPALTLAAEAGEVHMSFSDDGGTAESGFGAPAGRRRPRDLRHAAGTCSPSTRSSCASSRIRRSGATPLIILQHLDHDAGMQPRGPRPETSLRGIHRLISRRAGFVLDMVWTVMVFAFGLYLAWFGWVAAQNVPGMFWELGGMRKMVPMMALPLAGVLVAFAALGVFYEDALILMGRRPPRDFDAGGQEPI
jgi:hypothetical protein